MQGERSSLGASEGSACAYRGLGDRKCAVGILISDEQYDSDLEGIKVSNKVIQEALKKSGHSLLSSDVLADLQAIHDDRSICNWQSTLEGLGKHHGFSWPVIMADIDSRLKFNDFYFFMSDDHLAYERGRKSTTDLIRDVLAFPHQDQMKDVWEKHTSRMANKHYPEATT